MKENLLKWWRWEYEEKGDLIAAATITLSLVTLFAVFGVAPIVFIMITSLVTGLFYLLIRMVRM